MTPPPEGHQKQNKTDDSRISEERKTTYAEPPLEQEPLSAKLLAEAKEQFIQRHEFRKEQDERADKTMTMSSTIATLLIGLGAFLVTYLLQSDTLLFFIEVIILCIGIILAAGAIVFFLLAHQVRESIFPHSSAELNHILERSEMFSAENFEWSSVKAYTEAIESLQYRIIKKSKFIVMGQRLFLGSVLSVSIVLLIAIVGTAIWPSTSQFATNSTNIFPNPITNMN